MKTPHIEMKISFISKSIHYLIISVKQSKKSAKMKEVRVTLLSTPLRRKMIIWVTSLKPTL